ncbi:MAG TPA: four helix bundle suffix domain-containing protein [Pontiella sp.]|nr:four helix bundle suffix domain-containing protein [Pontiella sp.]
MNAKTTMFHFGQLAGGDPVPVSGRLQSGTAPSMQLIVSEKVQPWLENKNNKQNHCRSGTPGEYCRIIEIYSLKVMNTLIRIWAGQKEGLMSRIRKSGGYRKLATFQTATIIYDATHWFCERFLDARTRTVDQMVQAARSGRQNIAEGSRASATSSQTELRLVNVARASLEELLLDYEDFLRHRRLEMWELNASEAMAVRNVPKQFKQDRSDPSDLTDQEHYALYGEWLDNENPAIRANALICLIHQTNYLLDQQIAALEEQFDSEGGYSEKLAAERLKQRQTQNAADPVPACPQCDRPMVLRTARSGKNAGHSFWGCSAYPECKSVTKV